MAFAATHPARLPLVPQMGCYHEAAEFALCCGPVFCFPYWAFDTALRRQAFPPDAGSLLPGSLVITRTGLPPAGEYKLTNTWLSHHEKILL